MWLDLVQDYHHQKILNLNYSQDRRPFKLGPWNATSQMQRISYKSLYGFALAPAIGMFVADYLAGLPTPELDQLTPDRIAQFDPAHVAAFLAEPATSNVVE
jgi:hypothetical protein